MTAFAGIDFDTHAVHTVLLHEEGGATYHRFDLEGLDAFERARAVRDAMPSRGWWEDEGVIALGIEEPMGRGSVVQKLNVIQGAILSCLPHDLLVNPMRPSVWRTSVGLSGNASKDTVKEWIAERLEAAGWSRYRQPANYDFYDAYCLALAVQRLTVPV